MPVKPLTTLCIAAVLSLIHGCAVTEQMQRNFQEASEAYYAPEQLNGDPQETGLLLIDAVTEKLFNTMPLSGVAISNIDTPATPILVGSFKKGGILSQLSGVVVVPNLQPGTYRIIKINTQNANMWEAFPLPANKPFEVQVRRGQLSYLGQIHVKHPVGTTNREVSILHDKRREAEAWSMVVDKYGGSPWSDAITARIKELK